MATNIDPVLAPYDLYESNVRNPEPKANKNTPEQNIYNAYISGRMDENDAKEYKQALNDGQISLPPGVDFLPEATTAKQEPPDPTEGMSFIEKMGRVISGTDQATSETDATEDWVKLPELYNPSWKGTIGQVKTALGTIFSNPDETANIIKSNFPEIQVRQDEKGNYLFKSAINGKEYSLKPGLQASDIIRNLAGATIFYGASRLGGAGLGGQMLAAGGAQAGMEGVQSAVGGEFNPWEIPKTMGAELLGFGAGKVIQPALNKGIQGVKNITSKLVGGAQELTPGVLKSAPETLVGKTGQVMPEMPEIPIQQASEASVKDLAKTAKVAVEPGLAKSEAQRILAEEASPDPAKVEAAKYLNIYEDLTPEQLSESQRYRSLLGAFKMMPGSKARQAEIKAMEIVGNRADKIIEDLGGTTDLSTLDKNIGQQLQDTRLALETQAKNMFDNLDKSMPKEEIVKADNVLGFIRERERLSKGKLLTPMEKDILDALGDEKNPPNYFLLNGFRKKIGAALFKKEGEFANQDSRLLSNLYKLTSEDERNAISNINPKILPEFDLANATVVKRKELEDNMIALLGDNIQGTIIKKLNSSTIGLSTGDAKTFINFIKLIPEDMRKEVVASGLNAAFGKATKAGQINFKTFSDWYLKLKTQKEAYAALMSNLPSGAKKTLDAFYLVSDGIAKSSYENKPTGVVLAARQEMLSGTESLIGNIYDFGKRQVKGNLGMATALTEGLIPAKEKAIVKADELVSSPEFINYAKTGTEDAARRLAKSNVFQKYWVEVKKQKGLSDPLKFIIGSYQAGLNKNDETKANQ